MPEPADMLIRQAGREAPRCEVCDEFINDLDNLRFNAGKLYCPECDEKYENRFLQTGS